MNHDNQQLQITRHALEGLIRATGGIAAGCFADERCEKALDYDPTKLVSAQELAHGQPEADPVPGGGSGAVALSGGGGGLQRGRSPATGRRP